MHGRVNATTCRNFRPKYSRTRVLYRETLCLEYLGLLRRRAVCFVSCQAILSSDILAACSQPLDSISALALVVSQNPTMSTSPTSPTSPVSPVSPTMSFRDKKARAKGRAAGQAFLTLFDTTLLLNETAVESAISSAEHILAGIDSVDIDEFIYVIASVPYLLEFSLCGAHHPHRSFVPSKLTI